MPEQKCRKHTTMVVQKKGMLSCCKCLFEQIGANLDHFQAKNLQNVKKNAFLAKSSGSQQVKIDSVNGLKAAIRVFIC